MHKSDVFVKHIEQHLRELNISGKVMCKICNKDIDTIYNESVKVDNVVVYIDGSCKGNPGPGKSLALFKVNGGEFFTRTENHDNTTNNIAEYKALLLALNELKEEINYLLIHDVNKKLNIKLYTDSKLIVGQLTLGWKVNANVELVEHAKRLIDYVKKRHSIKISYVRREKNEAGIMLEKGY